MDQEQGSNYVVDISLNTSVSTSSTGSSYTVVDNLADEERNDISVSDSESDDHDDKKLVPTLARNWASEFVSLLGMPPSRYLPFGVNFHLK